MSPPLGRIAGLPGDYPVSSRHIHGARTQLLAVEALRRAAGSWAPPRLPLGARTELDSRHGPASRAALEGQRREGLMLHRRKFAVRPLVLYAALVLVAVGMAVGGSSAAAATPTYRLLVSGSPSRTSPVVLDGTTQSGNIYVFTDSASTTQQVQFLIDGVSQRV